MKKGIFYFFFYTNTWCN